MTQAEALNILKTGASVFLTGEPGAGKTHTINAYVRYLREHGIEPAITASTGIAATHIGGLTIHSWSGIGIKRHLTEYDLDKLSTNERVVKRVAAAKVLIIDEVSMLSPNTLSMVDAVCRTIKQSEEAFGGLQVVLVGDFFQLPPVVSHEDVSRQATLTTEPIQRFAYESFVWQKARFISCYLTEQHRQSDDAFLTVLAAIRANEYDEAHHEYLEGRRIPRTEVPAGIPRLFSHNIDVNRVNDDELAKLPGKHRVFEMTTQGAPLVVEALKKGCLSPETLTLKVGTKVMFTKNNFQAGFVNGTLGEVTSIDDWGMPMVKLWSGKVLSVEPAEWLVEDGGKVLARVSQLPLRLAWAITVHKSQGMSLDAAVMDLAQVFEYGQGYVALSRVRSLAGLYLLGWNEKCFQVHPEVLEKDRTFREDSEAAEEAFGKISPAELSKMHGNFIKAAGGTIEKGSKKAGKAKVVESGLSPAFAELRAVHPQAYRRWSEEEQGKLVELFKNGKSIKDLAEELGRKEGGIKARLIKVGLIEE